MRYVGTVYRPPSEAGSLLIQATIGCPHNKCRFCGMYKNKRFKIRPVKEILADLDEAKSIYGSSVRTLFLPDGNTIIMKTASLLSILNRAGELFPNLERITVYGSARYIALKSQDDLVALRKAGLKRIHMGLESGDDETLAYMCKGADSGDSIEAAKKVRRAGIELSLYYLVGIGGRKRSYEHALNSARAINAIQPEFIRLRTYYPVEAAPLYEDIMQERFELPDPDEALNELKILIENLDTRSMLLSDHVSNYINLSGKFPEDRLELLNELESAISSNTAVQKRFLTHL